MRIHVHIIAPYEAMVPIIQESIPLFPDLDIHYSVGDLARGAEMATIAENEGTEVIISRGGTAQLIKQSVSIPVIDMQLSGYDMIRSLTLAGSTNDKTAIVGFSNITSGAQSIIDLMDLPLKVYTVSSSNEVAPLLLKLKASGYRHIVGDVITFNTANSYGLNGLLIQSGKESIVKALEDAQLVHGYLTKKDIVSSILTHLVNKEHPNLIIANEQNEIMYEHLTHFSHNPLTEEHIHLLNANLAFTKTEITSSFKLDKYQLSVTANEISVGDHFFKVYLLKKSEPFLSTQKGLTVLSNISSEPIAAASHTMRVTLEHIEALYKRNETIHLQGPAGSGKSFIVSYLHQKFSAGGLLLTLDLSQCEPDQLHEIPMDQVRNIEICHAEQWSDSQKLHSFLETCRARKIGVFILSEHSFDRPFSQHLKLNTIVIPALSQRLEDLPVLMQYFLTDYHHQYGTTAVKIKDDALRLVEDQAPTMNISRLKELMKQAVLNEKDYVISADTIRMVLEEQSHKANPIPIKGTLREIEKQVIKLVLQEENNNQSKAAERLGINRATLWRKLKD